MKFLVRNNAEKISLPVDREITKKLFGHDNTFCTQVVFHANKLSA